MREGPQGARKANPYRAERRELIKIPPAALARKCDRFLTVHFWLSLPVIRKSALPPQPVKGAAGPAHESSGVDREWVVYSN